MDCPNCKKTQADGLLECADCGLIFEKWAKRQSAMVTGDFTAQAIGRTEQPSFSYTANTAPEIAQESGSMAGMIIKLILVGGLAYGGYQGYDHYGRPPSEACLAYQKFADHWAKGIYEGAKGMAMGEALEKVEAELAPPLSTHTTGGGMNMMGTIKQAFSSQAMNQFGRDLAGDMGGSIEKISYKIESENTSSNSSSIVAVQTVQRMGTASHSMFDKPTSQNKQTVEVRKDGDTWKISSFKSDWIKK